MDLSQIGNITESPYNNSGTNYSVENTTFYNDYAYYNYDYFAYPVFLRESLAGMFRKRMYLNLSMVLPQLLTVLINAYVIGCFAALEELRRGEYFLVFYQSFFDFLCSIIGLAYNSIVLLYFQDQYCIHRRFLSWMYGVDFKDIFMKCDMLSDYQWMNFRLVYYGDLRWPLEILSGVNYFSNCYCLIALAYERYVYTVKFADAKTILTTRRRVVTYSAIAFLTVLVPALLYLDVRLAEKRDGFFGIWGDCDSCFHRGGNENGTRIDFFKMYEFTLKLITPIVSGILYFFVVRELLAVKRVANKRLEETKRMLAKAFGLMSLAFAIFVFPTCIGQLLLFLFELKYQMLSNSIFMSLEEIKFDKYRMSIEALNYFQSFFFFFNAVILVSIVKPFKAPLQNRWNKLRDWFHKKYPKQSEEPNNACDLK